MIIFRCLQTYCGVKFSKNRYTVEKVYGRNHDLIDSWLTVTNIRVTNDYEYVPLVGSTSRYFPHS